MGENFHLFHLNTVLIYLISAPFTTRKSTTSLQFYTELKIRCILCKLSKTSDVIIVRFARSVLLANCVERVDERDKEIPTTILQSEWAVDVAKGLKRLLGINQVKLSRVLRKIILLRLHAQKSPWNTFHYVIMIIVYLNHLNCLHFLYSMLLWWQELQGKVNSYIFCSPLILAKAREIIQLYF